MATAHADLLALGVDDAQASLWLGDVQRWLTEGNAATCWRELTAHHLTPSVPFAIHQRLYQHVFEAWPITAGPPPAWLPTARDERESRVAQLLRTHAVRTVDALHALSVNDPEAFWRHALADLGIVFAKPPHRIVDLKGGTENARWLPEAQLSIVDSCLRGQPQSAAIVWQSPGQPLVTVTYAQLQTQVANIAAALRAHGLGEGDAVAINMPMIAESVSLYLGIVAAGMVVVSIADSMAPAEVATRLRLSGAKAIFTVGVVDRGGKRLALYEKVLQAAPPQAVVLQSQGVALRAGDVTWESFLANAPASAPLAPVVGSPDRVTNILFSSGTTGEPKAIPWTQLAPIKCAMDGAYHLDITPGDVVAWPTNLGWMMGPWLIYATLINQGTIALFNDAPTTRAFGEFIADARVNVLGVVPSIVKTWRSDDRMVGLDWSSLKCLGSTGEASNADDYLYLMMLAHYRPIIEYCGGTEIGGGYITGTLLQPASPATFTTPALGSRFVLLDEHGEPTNNGEVFLVPPTLGYSQQLLNRDHHQVYFEGTPAGPAGEPLRRHGDQIEQLPGGFYRAHGRIDDTMNLGGIKVSSAEIERVLEGVHGISRAAAIAVSPPGGGPSLLVVFVVATEPADALKPRLQEAIKTQLNPLFRIHDVVALAHMPVTASNKIMRRELRARYVAP